VEIVEVNLHGDGNGMASGLICLGLGMNGDFRVLLWLVLLLLFHVFLSLPFSLVRHFSFKVWGISFLFRHMKGFSVGADPLLSYVAQQAV
jgi:hypothetical protein